MSINKSGNWWKGTSSSDIKEYLEAYSAESYSADEFRLAKCKRGSETFHLAADDDEGCAKGTCTLCGAEHLICDSAEYLSSADLQPWSCNECLSTTANVGVGFSLYEDDEIRWLYVGERCAKCGILGCVAGWKIGYAPSKQRLDQA